MISGIPNKFFRAKKLAWILALLCSINGLAPLFGEDVMGVYMGEKSVQPSPMKESSEAVFGRVFGIQDEKLDIDYYAFELGAHKPGNSLARSALIPGWGQAFNGQTTKGVLFFSVFAAATAGSFIRYNKSNQSYNDYLSQGVKGSPKYDDYQTQRTQAYVLGGVAVGIWLFGMFDAYHQAYSPYLSDNNSLQFAFNTGDDNSLKSTLSWRRRF